MRKVFLFGSLAVGLMVALTVRVGADAPPKEKQVEEVPNPSHEPMPDFPPELIDDAFRTHLDPEFLRKAVATLEPGLLADAALQTLEGERILGRPNKVTPAAKLLELAVRTAGERGDKETLDRLTRRVAESGNKDVQERVRLLVSVVKPARSEDPVKKLEVEKQGEDAVELFRLVLGDIHAARTLRSRPALEGIEEGLKTLAGLTDKQIDYLRGEVRSALSSLPEKADEADDALLKLSGVSRAKAVTTVNDKIGNYCATKLSTGVVVMRGECAELAATAFVNSGVEVTRAMLGDNVDYVWGTQVRLVTPRHNVTGAVLPGDIVQYRNARFNDGGSAPHHTAVVRSVERNGSYLRVYQQNAGGVKKTTLGIVDLNGLTGGKIWIYRPAAGSAIFRIGIKNTTRSPITFTFDGKSYTLKAGQNSEYQTRTTTGTVRIGWSGGSATTDIAWSYPVEGQRQYEWGSTLKATGWVSGFSYTR